MEALKRARDNPFARPDRTHFPAMMRAMLLPEKVPNVPNKVRASKDVPDRHCSKQPLWGETFSRRNSAR
jgi:hypothetical protein